MTQGHWAGPTARLEHGVGHALARLGVMAHEWGAGMALWCYRDSLMTRFTQRAPLLQGANARQVGSVSGSSAVCEMAWLRRTATKSKVAPVELCMTGEGLGWHRDNEWRTEAYDAMAHRRGKITAVQHSARRLL
jgi:hypothetical protein